MADILIVKGRTRTYIYSQSLKGADYLRDHYQYKDRSYDSKVNVVVSISSEFADEVIQLFKMYPPHILETEVED